MYVQYSPLCDSDPTIYSRYLEVEKFVAEHVCSPTVGSAGAVEGGGVAAGLVGFDAGYVVGSDVYVVSAGSGETFGVGSLCGPRGLVRGVSAGRAVGCGGGEARPPVVDEEAGCSSETVSGRVVPAGVTVGSVSTGPNVERNRVWRKERKERKLRKKERDSVPEWRKKFASGDLADSWEARKIRENRIAVMKADEEIRRLESGAGNPRLQPKVLSDEEQAVKVRADYEAHMERRRNEIAKSKADQVYWTRRAEAGAVDKAIALEMEIMDGQISGKYDPFASKRTIGWAKTVKTSSSAGSSAKKTVWSGSGASGASKGVVSSQGSGTSVVSMEKYLKDLELKEKGLKVRVSAAVAESKAKNVELGKEVEELRERTKKTVSLDRYNLEVNFLKRKCAKDAEIAREQGLRGIRGHIVM